MTKNKGKPAAAGGGGSLGPKLLPATGTKKDNTPVLHAQRTPSVKRSRVESGSPTKETAGTDWHGRIASDTEWIKGKIGTAALGIKTDKVSSIGESLNNILTVTLVEIFERQASTNSDLCTEVMHLTAENKALKEQLAKQDDNINSVKACKEKVEVKASKKEMEDKVRFATTQVKVTNLDFGKAIEDRKELLNVAKETIRDKVRSDLKKEYDEKIRNASVRILASKTFKAQVDGKNIWTAPVIITIADKESRWTVENCLRSSKMFPSFHWPKEMMDNIKVFRKQVKDMGFPDTTHYIRIRPEERDGQWRIRADVKPKEGDGRFVSVASFEIPPLDDSLKANCAGWQTPVWKRPGVGPQENGEEEEEDEDEITEEDIIMHM
jgi:hypothetical protein